MTLISVKSKYGSCSGNCTGLINCNNTPEILQVLLNNFSVFIAQPVEHNTVNIGVGCSNHSKDVIIYIYSLYVVD